MVVTRPCSAPGLSVPCPHCVIWHWGPISCFSRFIAWLSRRSGMSDWQGMRTLRVGLMSGFGPLSLPASMSWWADVAGAAIPVVPPSCSVRMRIWPASHVDARTVGGICKTRRPTATTTASCTCMRIFGGWWPMNTLACYPEKPARRWSGTSSRRSKGPAASTCCLRLRRSRWVSTSVTCLACCSARCLRSRPITSSVRGVPVAARVMHC
ncbi:hypothetical protein D9M70_491890 [compost metagenome]